MTALFAFAAVVYALITTKANLNLQKTLDEVSVENADLVLKNLNLLVKNIKYDTTIRKYGENEDYKRQITPRKRGHH